MLSKRIICLYGGPGCGKSTTCAGLFYTLKKKDFNCEMNREYVKEWVWEGRSVQTGDQPYFFAKMARRERIYMQNGVDYIITDSPLVLTHFYGMKYDPMEQKHNTSLMMLRNHHEICKSHEYKVEHFVLERKKKYNPKGRFQTEEQAVEIDTEVKSMLDKLDIKYKTVDCDVAVEKIIEELGITDENTNISK